MTLDSIFQLSTKDRANLFPKIRVLINQPNQLTFDVAKWTVNYTEQIIRVTIRKINTTYSVESRLVIRTTDSFILATINNLPGTTEFSQILDYVPNNYLVFNDHFDPGIFDPTT